MKPKFSIGDAVLVTKPLLVIDGGVVNELIPATVVYATREAIGVCYADHQREMLEPQYVRKP